MSDEETVEAQHEGPPDTSHESKTVMLRAERSDTVDVEGHGQMVVAKRTATYFGPKLTLYCEDEETNYRLVAPSFATELELWKAVGEEFIGGWECLGEVEAELADTKQYDICACGEPLKTQEHERQAFLGIGEHA